MAENGPSIIEAVMNGQLTRAYELLQPCVLCPRACRANRRDGERGFCGIGRDAVVASWGPHYGEEPPLVGRSGSGTIFLAGCNLRCVFCRNHDISHHASGQEAGPRDIAQVMLELEARGCHNINFVTPTHVTPHLM